MPLFDRLPAEHLFDMHVELQPAQLISTTLGTRLTFITNGGVLEGPRLQGELLPGGGDWMLVGTDQIGRVDVRATLRTHDGALIHYETRGVIKVPADGLDRLAAGEVLPFEETYVRTTPKSRPQTTATRGSTRSWPSATTSCRRTTSTTASITCCNDAALEPLIAD